MKRKRTVIVMPKYNSTMPFYFLVCFQRTDTRVLAFLFLIDVCFVGLAYYLIEWGGKPMTM